MRLKPWWLVHSSNTAFAGTDCQFDGTTEITDWSPPHRFVDRELRGPYALWNHEYWFKPQDGRTRMNDRVTYALPLGIVGKLAHAIAVEREVEKIFDFRAETMRRRELAEMEGKAGARSQSMLVAQMLLCAGFLIFILYPAMVRIFQMR